VRKMLSIAITAICLCESIVNYVAADVPVFVAPIEQVAGALEANVDLGVVPAGERFAAEIELVNSLPYELPIEQMKTYCSCIKLSSRSSTIPPGGSLMLDLELNVAKDGKSADEMEIFWIRYAPDASITVFLRFRKGGMVSFKNNVHYHTKVPLGNQSHDFRIPILITAPSDLSRILIESDSLGKLETTLTEDRENGTQWLNCRMPIKEGSNTKLGLIRLQDPILNKHSEIQVVVEVIAGLEVMPRALRFMRSQNSYTATANAIVKIDKSLLRLEKDKSLELPVSIQFAQGGKEIQTEQVRVTQGIYRVKLIWTANSDEEFWKGIEQVNCTVNTGKSVRTMGTISAIVE
jgi:hypothetical protein